jgi:large subunit ribosomal protein L25
MPIQLSLKDFKVLYDEAGESTLIDLEMGDKIFSVLINDVKEDPITGEFTHVDFYQPILTEEVEADVPLVFEGESLAVKDLGATLIKEIQYIAVKALPRDLPHEIKVDISSLKTFDDEILVKDLKVADNVKIQKDLDEVVALVMRPQKEEIEEKPVEEAIVEGEEKTAEKVETGEVKENEE